jgi:YidC/Oxa1 family membrane protein insertase
MNFLTEYNAVQKILKERHQLVVYAESRHYYQYFESLLQDVLNNSSIQILYISSDKNDPILNASGDRMQVVYIKQFLGLLFPKIKADIMIMTMPDLNNFLYKRSSHVQEYIYVFHAAVSTHLQYREKAFFYYDSIFCTGPYQEKELRKAEITYGLPAKELISYGYPLMDSIKRKYEALPPRVSNSRKKILIAPSWFEACILETCIERLVQELSRLDYEIDIRSHPEYIKRLPKKYKGLKKIVSDLPNVHFDEAPEVLTSLIDADILITDRSGIALEYAFGTYRPVLFIDTPLKISNPNWQKLGLEPIENDIRSMIGMSVLPDEISTIPQKLHQLESDKEKYRSKLEELEREIFFNSPQSYAHGLDYILQNLITH